MIARPEQPEDRINRGHARSKNVGGVAAFEFGESFFERLAVGMIGPRVVVALAVFAELFLDVGRGLINWRDDGASGGIGLLPDVNGVGGKTHSKKLPFLSPARCAAALKPADEQSTSPTSDAMLDSLCGTDAESAPHTGAAWMLPSSGSHTVQTSYSRAGVTSIHCEKIGAAPNFPTTMRKDRS